jgi:hypothetical protein
MNIKKWYLLLCSALFGCSDSTQHNNAETLTQAGQSTPIQKQFKEAGNTAVFTTKFVVVDHKDITEVHHDADDGAWQFFSNDSIPETEFMKVAKMVALSQITQLDATLFEIADLPQGYIARRKFKGDQWVIEKK